MGEYQGCHKCKYGNNQPTEYPCLECVHNRAIDNFEPKTNADRIRNMSDEELAELLNNANIMCEWKKGNCERSCIECTLKWLQAEVKEGEEDERS